MDGLEAVEMKLSDIKKDENRRCDSEYFKKKNLELLNKIIAFGYKEIEELAFVTDGIHESIDFCEESKINLISAKSPKENTFDLSGSYFISERQHKENHRTELKNEDVIISTVGTIGNCAVVDNSILPANSDRHVGIVRILDNYKPRCLSTFILSKYGRFQTLRESTGNVQLNLYIYKIKKLKVPNFSAKFQEKIEYTVKVAHKKIEQSKQLYFEAENILLEEFGLKDWKPSEKSIEVKSFKESFGVSGRLDAEYYQPKYDEIEEHIKKYEVKNLNEIVTIKKSIEPGTGAYSDEGIPFVRVSNLSKFELTEPDIKISPLLAIEELKPKKDTILLTKDGSVGIAYKVEKNLNVITSGAILHLNIFDINILPDYLTTVLNSLVVKLQAQRDAGGSIIQHWRIGDIEKIMIPILPMIFQEEISKKIKESFTLKEKSKQLLEIAKLGVEKAIEENEEEAIKWIESEILKIETVRGV